MKCMFVVNTPDKNKVLTISFFSIEQKVRDGKTYLWYEDDFYANEDAEDLRKHGMECTLKAGWENDGFVTFNI